MKGLVVDEPWIGYLLDGSKTWEMRSQATTNRGWVALIAKGTGKVVGAGRLVAVGDALDKDGMIAAIPKHRIPEAMIRSGAVGKWTIPWIFEGVVPLARPVAYDHPSGAVTWVVLDEAVSAAVERQVDGPGRSVGGPPADPMSPAAPSAHASPRAAASLAPPASRSGGERVIGRSRITQGNLDNHHFYMRDFLDRFPPDALGGSNKAEAGHPVRVDWGGGGPVETDVDRTKGFFRMRGWVRAMFARAGAKPGAHVVVAETGPRDYRVWVED